MLEAQQRTRGNIPEQVPCKVELSQGALDPPEGVGAQMVEFVPRDIQSLEIRAAAEGVGVDGVQLVVRHR